MGRRSTTTRSLSLAAGVLVAMAAIAHAPDADACGACYASSSESTVVNDHRMAFSIQKQRTILWDQIVYAGNPREFAYVIPAKPGTKLEASTSAWFSALETSTRPIIMAPQGGYGGGGYGGNDYGGGCCSSMTSADALSAGSSESSRRENVEVVAQSVVGPYETVTIRSTDAQALQTWLVDHGYAVPESSGPIIASYVEAGLDFIALRLQPGKDVRAMEPIRIISPGTDISLPLRMMQIGAGAKVGITLYVIAEGRYRSGSFPEAPIDFTKLIWDYAQARSNYQELSLAAMATENGRGFITEYADRPSFDANAPAATSGMTSNTPLASAYAAACPTYGQPRPKPSNPDPYDAGTGADSSVSDAGADASNDDAGDDAGTDASTEPESKLDAGKGAPSVAACDDLDLAVADMNLNDVMLTRLRANLPNAALADTLRLEPAPKQEKLDNVHYAASTGTIPTARIARLHTSRTQGTYALVAFTAMVLSRLMRRKPKA